MIIRRRRDKKELAGKVVVDTKPKPSAAVVKTQETFADQERAIKPPGESPKPDDTTSNVSKEKLET